MAVLAIKTEPLCKLCRSEKRAEADALLELRSNRTRDPETGQLLYTLPVVLEKLAALGIENPTEENIKNHWKKHCSRVSDEQIETAQAAALARIEELRAGGNHASADDVLRTIVSIYDAQIAAQLEKGELPVITTEQAMKAIGEMTKRSASEKQHELLTMFAVGMGEAAKAIAGRPTPKQIEGAEVIDAEFTEVEES